LELSLYSVFQKKEANKLMAITFSNLNRFVAKSLVAYFFGTQYISNGFFDVECDAMVDMTVNDL